MREATQFIFEDTIRPLNDEAFANIELAIRSLRDMTKDDKYEFIVVAFKNIIENLDFIQAHAVKSYKTCYIELGFLRKGKKFPQIFALDDMSIEETIAIFRSVCCSLYNPDLSEWKDKTYEILKNEEIEDT